MRQPNSVVGGETHDRQERIDSYRRYSRGRSARQRAECRAGRPLRVGEDNSGGGSPHQHGRHSAGRTGGGRQHRQRLRRGRGPAAALREPHPSAGGARRDQGQSSRYPRVRRLHRRPAGGPAGRGRRTVHRAGHRRRGRPDPDAVGGVCRGRHAAGRGHHQAGSPAGRLRRGPAGLPGRVRRFRRPALPAGDLGTRGRGGAHRPAVRPVLRLHQRDAHRARPGPGPGRPHGGTAQLADRGRHPGERRRNPHGPVPVRGDHRSQGADRGPGEGGRPGQLLPGAGHVEPAGHRPGRAAGDHDAGLPLPGRASAARRDHAGRQAGDRAVLRPGGAAAGRGGQDRV